MAKSPNVFYVGDRVEVWVDYQGWRPATLTQVHPSFSARRDSVQSSNYTGEPFPRTFVRRPKGHRGS